MHQIPNLYIAYSDEKDRGVYTTAPISIGDTIESCPVIIIPKAEIPIIHKTYLHDFYFLWGEKHEEAAISLGYGSIYNHATHPNANFFLDLVENTIEIFCVKPINPGEEILINYHGEPGDESPLWFEIK